MTQQQISREDRLRSGAVEELARDGASLALLTGRSPTPNGAFDKPLTMAQVLKIAKPLIA